MYFLHFCKKQPTLRVHYISRTAFIVQLTSLLLLRAIPSPNAEGQPQAQSAPCPRYRCKLVYIRTVSMKIPTGSTKALYSLTLLPDNRRRMLYLARRRQRHAPGSCQVSALRNTEPGRLMH